VEKSHKVESDQTYSLFFASFSLRSVTNIAVPQFPLPSVLSTRYRFASTSFRCSSDVSEELLAVVAMAADSVGGNGILCVMVSAQTDSCSIKTHFQSKKSVYH